MEFNYIYGTNGIGTFLLPDVASDEIIHAIRNGYIYDYAIANEFANYVKPDSVAVDFGANVGQMSVLMAKLFSKVYAVEADPFMTKILEKNLELNNITNCEVISKAAWHTSGEYLPFPEPDLKRFESLGSYGITLSSDTDRKVVSFALDDLNLDNVALIKVDVQGSDLFALQGSIETIKRCKPAIIFEYEPIFNEDFGTSVQDYRDFIKSIDYRRAKVVSPNNYLVVPGEDFLND